MNGNKESFQFNYHDYYIICSLWHFISASIYSNTVCYHYHNVILTDDQSLCRLVLSVITITSWRSITEIDISIYFRHDLHRWLGYIIRVQPWDLANCYYQLSKGRGKIYTTRHCGDQTDFCFLLDMQWVL